MVPAFHQLYEDLQSTDSVLLLDVNKPAFDFVSEERFTSTRYDNDICEAISQVTSVYRTEVIKIIKMMLPSLAEGFLKQKGAIFGFGEVQESEHALSRTDSSKLDQAPVHNIAAERSVGFINYELSRRGARELQCASSAQVKCKSSDLTE